MKEATGAGRTQKENQLAALGEDRSPLGTDLSLKMQARILIGRWRGQNLASFTSSEHQPGAASSRSCCPGFLSRSNGLQER